MFHPKELVHGGLLETVWKAVHDISTEADDEEIHLPEICRRLDTWIFSEAYQEDRRLSLRTSATLITGVAKLYKISICKLFEDSSSSGSYDSSEYAATPEQTRHGSVQDFGKS
ncbi:unnamed protein product [Arctia plantaginis]|uniref:Uncharacterized protein n=1 Tax=Arctia plantaginis TaxID=874455 RepID=A0A8S1AKI9_ARCPL|nr:unnamed protein product [Arctia plantaginis]CAB3245964.1 unnamed protein product [Arctia plantaginis]